jgi:glycosyltransferase involved in cell wall biosynthesis
MEKRLSVHSLMQVHSFALPLVREFRRADIVHYHIIHDGFFSLLALPWLCRIKPSVWTWHDPWPMTGHCIYPLTCERWKTGCGSCPDLSLPFPMKEDKTAGQFRLKRRLYSGLDADIVLASRWMLDMARRSPLTAGLRLHHIPFGINLEKFRPRPALPARERLGILAGRKVICLRAFASPFKGLDYLLQALDRLKTDQPLCLVTFHDKGRLNHMIGRHQIIELGWSDDESELLDAYAAANFFVMPSTAEAFGMMAIEAMACGRPVICFEGTSLPDVTFAPKAGLAVPMGDVDALAAAIERWLDNPGECEQRGVVSRQMCEEYYDEKLQAGRLAELYHDRSSRTNKSSRTRLSQAAETKSGAR